MLNLLLRDDFIIILNLNNRRFWFILLILSHGLVNKTYISYLLLWKRQTLYLFAMNCEGDNSVIIPDIKYLLIIIKL